MKLFEDSDYVDDEEATIKAACIVPEAEAAARWRREEAAAVRRVKIERVIPVDA
jgi:hypothetical protein